MNSSAYNAITTRSLGISLLLLLASVAAWAGFRAPGPYNGVVIFDRWDACYLYSGIYLMPVSEQIKEELRNFEGKFVLLDAQDVYQPMNPGDGLIRKIGLVEIGKARTARQSIAIDGLALRLAPIFDSSGVALVELEIENRGSEVRKISLDDLGLTLLSKQDESRQFEPADGPSFALMTRVAVTSLKPSFVREWSIGDRHWRYEITAVTAKAGTKNSNEYLKLEPGQRKTVATLKFSLLPGEYEFLAGYGGGVHESPVLVSNRVAFDVSKEGVAELVLLPAKPGQTRASACDVVVREPAKGACGRHAMKIARHFQWRELVSHNPSPTGRLSFGRAFGSLLLVVPNGTPLARPLTRH